MSLLAAIVAFGLIILFHEFGHFLLAKRGGICVVEFSLGMGPRILSTVKGGTRYSLKLFPFGGSCMMLGEDEDLTEEDPEERAGERIAEKAGMASGKEDQTENGNEPEKENGLPRSYAGIELPPGATGVSFNETSVWTRFLVIAAGPVFNFILAFIGAFFIICFAGYNPASVYAVTEGFPAVEAGLEPGDRITKLNGKRMWVSDDVLNYMGMHANETLTVEFKRGAETMETVLEPRYSEEYGRYLIGISFGGRKMPESVLITAKYSFYELFHWVDTTFVSLQMILRRQVTTNDIAGPIRIVSMLDTTVKENREYGLMTVLLNLTNICVLLSVNLGIMNLLPIPALDGGRIVFLLLEALRGRPVDREKEGMIHMAGMAALMVLMVFILFNDIRNLL